MPVFDIASAVGELDDDQGRDESPLMWSGSIQIPTPREGYVPTRRIRPCLAKVPDRGRGLHVQQIVHDGIGQPAALSPGRFQGCPALETPTILWKHGGPEISRKSARIDRVPPILLLQCQQDLLRSLILPAQWFSLAIVPNHGAEEYRGRGHHGVRDDRLVKRKVMSLESPCPGGWCVLALDSEETNPELIRTEQDTSAPLLHGLGQPNATRS